MRSIAARLQCIRDKTSPMYELYEHKLHPVYRQEENLKTPNKPLPSAPWQELEPHKRAQPAHTI